MKKVTVYMMILLLCSNILAGCQETPEEVMVTPKGQNGNLYEEASGESISGEEEAAEPVQKIGERLGIEDSYSVSLTSPDQRTDFTAENAKVEYPDAGSLPVYEVSLQEFDQDFVDEITEALFGDAPVYHEWDYNTRTKSERMEEIEYIKECLARGNTDPFGWKSAGNSSLNIEEYLADLQGRYADAPEEYTHKAISPEIGFDPEAHGFFNPGDMEYGPDDFQGYAVVDEDHTYYYALHNGNGNQMIQMFRDRSKEYGGAALSWDSCEWRSCYGEIMREPEGEWVNEELYQYNISGNLSEIVGITQEEAQKQADAFVKKLDMVELEVSSVNPSRLSYTQNWGYEFHYVRKVDGIPMLYTSQENYIVDGDDSGEETKPNIRYEMFSVVVSDEGIESLEIINLSKLEAMRVENPAFLSWKEITKKFEDMMLIQYAEMEQGRGNDSYHRYFDIEKIVLSYMRIEEADTEKLLLIPVWDFLGREWNQDKIDRWFSEIDDELHMVNGQMYLPYALMTINAIDGSVIDRERGY